MGEDYSVIQPSFEASTTNQSSREKNRNNRSTPSRNSRIIQQSQQQQQQNAYQASAQQQNTGFQTQQPQSYATMEIQAVQLTSVPNQPQPMQIASLNEQSAVNANQISSIAAATVQNLVQHNFAAQAGNPPLQTQHSTIRPLPTVAPISSKPYKIVQPQQQCYKFPNLVQNLNAQQFKFNADSLKVAELQ